jgi:predicted helicase
MSEYELVKKVNGYFKYLRDFVSNTGLSAKEVNRLRSLVKSSANEKVLANIKFIVEEGYKLKVDDHSEEVFSLADAVHMALEEGFNKQQAYWAVEFFLRDYFAEQFDIGLKLYEEDKKKGDKH